MKKGYLSQFFSGVAVKTLSAVEADFAKSNQHEFNGVEGLKRIFGEARGKQTFDARFLYLSDRSEEPVISDGFLTWYDAREAHPTRSEHRLYFPTTDVANKAGAGDLLVIGRRQDGSVLVVIAESESTVANQVRWLFGFAEETRPGFSVRAEDDADKVKLEFASRLILEEIGITPEEDAPSYLDIMLEKFGKKFPATRTFSEFARSTLTDVHPQADPDAALATWMEREELLFRTLERHIVKERLAHGFAEDVDGFLAYSLSVQNRRKARVGSALENHVEEIFIRNGIRYKRTPVTENKAKPDFIFPGIEEYRDPAFPAAKLRMLGVKSTCKDRWRQVLAEADRVEAKHLLTLEPGISKAQTDEMRDKRLSLVIPAILHQSYTPAQRGWLMNVAEFVGAVRQDQSK